MFHLQICFYLMMSHYKRSLIFLLFLWTILLFIIMNNLSFCESYYYFKLWIIYYFVNHIIINDLLFCVDHFVRWQILTVLIKNELWKNGFLLFPLLNVIEIFHRKDKIIFDFNSFSNTPLMMERFLSTQFKKMKRYL